MADAADALCRPPGSLPHHPLRDHRPRAGLTTSAGEAVYQAIAQRRDMRHFTPGQRIDPAVMQRLLTAAHAGPVRGADAAVAFHPVDGQPSSEAVRELAGRTGRTAQAMGNRDEFCN